MVGAVVEVFACECMIDMFKDNVVVGKLCSFSPFHVSGCTTVFRGAEFPIYQRENILALSMNHITRVFCFSRQDRALLKQDPSCGVLISRTTDVHLELRLMCT